MAGTKYPAREFKSTDPEIAEFVKWVTEHDEQTWLSYLVLNGLNAHLSKYLGSSPFRRGTHLDTRIIQLIHRFGKTRSGLESIIFRQALQQHIRDNKLVGKAFDYNEP